MIRTRGRGVMITFAVVALALVVAGCTTTQSPARQLDDNAIHAAVKAKLTADRFSNLLNVDVNVTNGVVTLAGEVITDEDREYAEEVARGVMGVRAVVNDLRIQPPPLTGM